MGVEGVQSVAQNLSSLVSACLCVWKKTREILWKPHAVLGSTDLKGPLKHYIMEEVTLCYGYQRYFFVGIYRHIVPHI